MKNSEVNLDETELKGRERLVKDFEGNTHHAFKCALKIESTLKQIRIYGRTVTDDEIEYWENLRKSL